MSQTSADAAALGEELRNIVDHAEALLGALGDAGDPSLDGLRDRVSQSIETARLRLEEMQSDTDRASERAAAAIDRWITENPWAAVAIGLGLGLAAGYLLAGGFASRDRGKAPDTPASR